MKSMVDSIQSSQEPLGVTITTPSSRFYLKMELQQSALDLVGRSRPVESASGTALDSLAGYISSTTTNLHWIPLKGVSSPFL